MTNQTHHNNNLQSDNELDPQIHQLLDNLDDPMDEVEHDVATQQLLQSLDSFKPQTVTSGEVSDGVPDQVQESTRLDRRAQQRLEHQHDEIDFEPTSTPSPDTAIQSDARRDPARYPRHESRERIPVPTHTDRPMGELPDGVEDSMQESDEHRGTAVVYLYRIAVQLPTTIQQMVDTALAHIGLPPQPSDFQLLASFQTESIEAVTTQLADWVSNYLPITTGFGRVYTAVVGQNTYIAGWHLTNTQTIQHAQTALSLQLDPLITPIVNTQSIHTTILPILLSVPAEHYPQLVGFLQHHFEETIWHIDSIGLLRRPVDSDEGWETFQQLP